MFQQTKVLMVNAEDRLYRFECAADADDKEIHQAMLTMVNFQYERMQKKEEAKSDCGEKCEESSSECAEKCEEEKK